MSTRTIETSPQVYARLGGFFYLLIILTGAFGQIFARGPLIVSGDAAATAHNIMASQSLWRLGLVGDLMTHVFDVPVMLVFYVLLRPVHKNLALLAVLFNLVQTAVLVANKINLVLPLLLLGSPDYLKALGPQQLYALTYLFVQAHDYGFGLGLIFFGFECLVVGYLIFRSGYLPRLIGVLMQIAGLCYLTNSFALLLAPALASIIFPAILLPALLGEGSLCLWLLIKGVNLEKWQQRALESA